MVGSFVYSLVCFMLKTSCKPLLQSLWLQQKRNQSLPMKALVLAAQMLCSALMLTWCPAHKSPVSRGERVSPSHFHVQNDDRVRIFSDGSCFGQKGLWCCQSHLDSQHFGAQIKPRLSEERACSHVCLCWHSPSPFPCKASPQVWKEQQL